MTNAISSLETIPVSLGAPLENTRSESDSVIPKAQEAPLLEVLGDGHFFVGHSRALREISRLVALIAPTSVPVLVLGETGTGKEAVVRLIHALSLRRNRPLLKLNCAALPAELLESELFGYEAGAFTGAMKAKQGKFEICHKGTILLDEIAEMPAAPQAKLLHVLQDGTFCRLGSSSPVRVDARVLAATNVDISAAIKSGAFREDLYYRLNAFSIHIPPLRERKEDIPVLIEHFVRNQAISLSCEPLPLSADLLHACLGYSWPGNVRELENFVKRHLIVRDEKKAFSELNKGRMERRHGSNCAAPISMRQDSDLKSLVRGLKQEAERQAIIGALELAGGSRKEAARRLNISSRALLYKMKDYGISVGHNAAPQAA